MSQQDARLLNDVIQKFIRFCAAFTLLSPELVRAHNQDLAACVAVFGTPPPATRTEFYADLGIDGSYAEAMRRDPLGRREQILRADEWLRKQLFDASIQHVAYGDSERRIYQILPSVRTKLGRLSRMMEAQFPQSRLLIRASGAVDPVGTGGSRVGTRNLYLPIGALRNPNQLPSNFSALMTAFRTQFAMSKGRNTPFAGVVLDPNVEDSPAVRRHLPPEEQEPIALAMLEVGMYDFARAWENLRRVWLDPQSGVADRDRTSSLIQELVQFQQMQLRKTISAVDHVRAMARRTQEPNPAANNRARSWLKWVSDKDGELGAAPGSMAYFFSPDAELALLALPFSLTEWKSTALSREGLLSQRARPPIADIILRLERVSAAMRELDRDYGFHLELLGRIRRAKSTQLPELFEKAMAVNADPGVFAQLP